MGEFDPEKQKNDAKIPRQVLPCHLPRSAMNSEHRLKSERLTEKKLECWIIHEALVTCIYQVETTMEIVIPLNTRVTGLEYYPLGNVGYLMLFVFVCVPCTLTLVKTT